MARLNATEGFDILKDRVSSSVNDLFPIVGKKHTLELKEVNIDDQLSVDDIKTQKQAKISGRTWAVPVEAKISLKNTATGKTVDEQTVRLFNLPKVTNRYSNIVDGQEYQIDNQWRLKSGVYARVKDNGELESTFNLAKGRGFKVGFDPKSRDFNMRYGTSHVPLRPLLREMGISQEDIEKTWGKQIAKANEQDSEKALMKFYKASTGTQAKDVVQARDHLLETFGNTEMRPEVNKITLGKPHDKVTGSALLDASSKLLQVSQGKAEPDTRDALMFKELHSSEDFFAERLHKGTRDIMRRVNNTLDRKTKIKDIVGPDVFGKPIKDMYRNTLANIPDQTNPLEMLSGQMKTTIMGEGGIKSGYGVTEDAKLVDPSHLGFLDPIHTPEGESTGVALRLPLGIKKSGHDVKVTMYNLKTGKNEQVNPEKMMESKVVLPDQVRWVDGKPVAASKSVKISTKGNDIIEGSMKDAAYVMRDPLQMFSMSSNLVPFLAADHPNRSTMAGRHMEQAISLKEREAPLVQSLAGSKDTFEDVMGTFAGHAAPVAGTVVSVDKESIRIKDKEGVVHERQLYDHFPLNAAKTFIHSTPTVKEGDSVKKGQGIADTNYTKGGQLALGVNLKVGYMPYKGYNFEDGVVISETAAKKMSSEHLYRKGIDTDKSHVLSKSKFQAYVPDAMTREQADKLDNDGVMKPGQLVMPGDTIIAALQHKTDRHEDKEIAKIHKSLIRPYKDASVKWESDHPGEVIEVVKRGRQTTVHVKTTEPMEIGDKLCFTLDTEVLTKNGWKFVADVTLNDVLYTIKDGNIQLQEPEAVHHYPIGGELYELRTQQVDLNVTANHKLYIKHRGRDTFNLVPASSVIGKRVRHKKDGKWSAESPEVFWLPELEAREEGKGCKKQQGAANRFPGIPLQHWATFLGIFLANGSYSIKERKDRPGTIEYMTVIHSIDGQKHSVSGDQYAWICSVLDECGFPYTRRPDRLLIHSKQLTSYLSQFGHAADKHVPRECFSWSAQTARGLMEGLMGCDGNKQSSFSYCTVSRQLADDVQVLALHCGYAANIKIRAPSNPWRWSVRYDIRMVISKCEPQVNHSHAVSQSERIYVSDEPVVGITVPNGTVYVRVNGKAVWTGNSGRHGNKGIVTCFSNDSEVLTDAGWKYFKELDQSELICTKNPETGAIEYHAPTSYIDTSYTGKMYCCEGRRLSLLVTPEHKHYVRTRRGKYRLELAESCFGLPRVHSRTGSWQGEEVDTFTVPGLGCRHKGHKKFEQDREYDFDLFLEMFGYWVTEGCLGGGSHIHFAQDGEAHPDTYARIVSVLERLGYDGCRGEKAIVISDPRLYAWLSQFGKATEKYIPREFLFCSVRQLRILAEAIFDGDGGVYYREKDNHTRHELFTSSKRLADDYQELALKLGVSANIKPQEREDRNIEYVVLWSWKSEVWVNNDNRYVNESWRAYSGRVYCVDVPNHIIYVRRNGIPVWSGNSIIPDDEMPRTKDGALQVLLNPTGVAGRTNLGQILETAAAKVAEKTGKPYVIKNFQPDTDLHSQVVNDLKKHGLTDKEEVFDPNGRKLGDVLVGPQHIFKLKHQVEKKLVARAGGPGYAYDRSMVPQSGGPHSAQRLGTLGLYSMLAHGAKHNLREMQTVKSDAAQSDAFWAALQAGESLPAPRPTFAYNKFTSYLNALGVNVKKEGNNLSLIPFTDKQVKDMSNGAIKDAGRMVRAKDLKPEVGGLFDPKITGGIDGTKWSHMKLPEPFPNPLFEKSIRSLTGMNSKDFDAIVGGRKAIDTKTGKIIDDLEEGVTGGKAIGALLKKIDVDKELESAKAALSNPSLKGNLLDRANKKVKYLDALKSAGLSAHDAYMMKNVPVMPPSMRPISQLPNGSLNIDDLNNMYKGISLSSSRLAKVSPLLPEEEKAGLRTEIYDGLKSLTGLGGHNNQRFRGIIDILGGNRPDLSRLGSKVGSPKYGFFQKSLVQRKQDLSMRSTIIPEPSLGLDEVAIPRKAALELYKPFIVKEMRGLMGVSPLQAQQMIKDGGPMVNKALERVMDSRPILLKRDPVLHKHGIQAFNPRVTGGKAMKIHPLVTSGFNADFDGDAMAAFVPVSTEAVEEARGMFPSRNLFSPSTGDLMYKPTLESQLGLYGVGQVGDKTSKKFSNIKDVESAHRKGEVKLNDQIKVGGLTSTVGRFMVAGALPDEMKSSFLKSSKPLDKKGQTELLTRVAKEHKNDYGEVVNKLKDLGNMWSTETAFTIGLDDIKPEKKDREAILSKAEGIIASSGARGSQFDAKAIREYDKATQEMHKKLDTLPEKTNALMLMHKSGIKPDMDTLRQIKMAPMLIANAKGEVIPTPAKRSYSEGLDVADYWTSMSGSRKGIIQKVQQVRDPGYISKQVMNSVMNNVVIDNDCGTKSGINLRVDEKDVLDRYLASDVKAGRRTFKSGTLVTPEVRNSLRNNKINRVMVRTPLRCQHGPGVCKKCFGLTEEGKDPDVGLNVGILSGQALGERATQLSMKAFHSGGTAASREGLVDEFQRVKDLLLFPKILKGSATLSNANGVVSKVQKDPAGGHNVYVRSGQDDVRHYVPQKLGAPSTGDRLLRKGDKVRKGMALSRGPVNPHEMLPLTGVGPVQGYLADELHKIYGPTHGIRRRNTEMVVKALTNLTHIEDPGDHGYLIRGDFAPTSLVSNLNRQSKGLKPIVHSPVLKGVNVLPLDMQEDWMARMNHERIKDTVIAAAQQGWTSKIQGTHPIPPVVYGAGLGRSKPGEY